MNLPNWVLWLDISIIFLGTDTSAQTFTDIGADLTGISCGAVAWGDYDNDGDLDILIAGEDSPFNVITKVYRNDGNEVFNDISANLTGFTLCSLAWGDYDNDGDLDILISGQISPYVVATMIYRNNGNGAFSKINAGIIGTYAGAVAWGDFDNDGDLDIVLSGGVEGGDISKVYRNEGNGNFTDIQANMTGVSWSAVAWGDYDNDHDLDLLLAGEVNNGPSDEHISKIYRNDGGGVFTDINAGLIGASRGSVAWGDYDSDGDLDILLTGGYGLYNEYSVSKIYRNDGDEVFTDINADLRDVSFSDAAWGDYDNDGDLDILLTGWKNMSGPRTNVYRNDGNGTFVDINDNLMIVEMPSVAWGDYDTDGDLDFLLGGFNSSTGPYTMIYRNDGGFSANVPPSSPAEINETVHADSVLLSWHHAIDNETPSPSLTYNLRVGTTPGGVDIISPMADAAGYRRIVSFGSANLDTTWMIKNLAEGTYYWSVQAVDNAFAGSPFALEDSFSIVLTDAGEPGVDLPKAVMLYQCYPNPFNPSTTIMFDLPEPAHVKLCVYNVKGELIATLVNQHMTEGRKEVTWGAKDNRGQAVSSGIYFYRLVAGDFVPIKKMVLLR